MRSSWTRRLTTPLNVVFVGVRFITLRLWHVTPSSRIRLIYRTWPSNWTLNVVFRRCSSAEERLNTRPLNQLISSYTWGTTWGWLSAHNGEDVGSKPTTGNHSLWLDFRSSPSILCDVYTFKTTVHHMG